MGLRGLRTRRPPPRCRSFRGRATSGGEIQPRAPRAQTPTRASPPPRAWRAAAPSRRRRAGERGVRAVVGDEILQAAFLLLRRPRRRRAALPLESARRRRPLAFRAVLLLQESTHPRLFLLGRALRLLLFLARPLQLLVSSLLLLPFLRLRVFLGQSPFVRLPFATRALLLLALLVNLQLLPVLRLETRPRFHRSLQTLHHASRGSGGWSGGRRGGARRACRSRRRRAGDGRVGDPLACACLAAISASLRARRSSSSVARALRSLRRPKRLDLPSTLLRSPAAGAGASPPVAPGGRTSPRRTTSAPAAARRAPAPAPEPEPEPEPEPLRARRGTAAGAFFADSSYSELEKSGMSARAGAAAGDASCSDACEFSEGFAVESAPRRDSTFQSRPRTHRVAPPPPGSSSNAPGSPGARAPPPPRPADRSNGKRFRRASRIGPPDTALPPDAAARLTPHARTHRLLGCDRRGGSPRTPSPRTPSPARAKARARRRARRYPGRGNLRVNRRGNLHIGRRRLRSSLHRAAFPPGGRRRGRERGGAAGAVAPRREIGRRERAPPGSRRRLARRGRPRPRLGGTGSRAAAFSLSALEAPPVCRGWFR